MALCGLRFVLPSTACILRVTSVPTALRFRRNRSFLHGIAMVLVLSGLGLLVSRVCPMSLPLGIPRAAMPDCPGERVPDHGHAPGTDCRLQPCLASPSGPGVVVVAPDPPDVPLGILCLVWWPFGGFRPLARVRIPWLPDPPRARRIPLTYWFCVLLN